MEATTLTLSEEEARWLATAVSVLRRVLQGFPSQASDRHKYCIQGLSVLYRVAEQLPPGHYISGEDCPRFYGVADGCS